MPPAPKPRLAAGLLVLRSLTVLVGCLGLAWALANVARADATDEFRDAEARLLQFETFNRSTAIRTLESAAARESDPCDSRAQHVLMLLEIPLADAALRSGAVRGFDQRLGSLEARSRQTLACAPRDSFVWLVLFGLETEHGMLDQHAFDLLAMSYDTSPNEAWIAIRRTTVAIPVVPYAPEPIQRKILDEFQNLVSHGYVEMTGRAYLNASARSRALLQSRIDRLDSQSQRTFADALQKLGS